LIIKIITNLRLFIGARRFPSNNALQMNAMVTKGNKYKLPKEYKNQRILNQQGSGGREKNLNVRNVIPYLALGYLPLDVT
jgi:hypothetical protein